MTDIIKGWIAIGLIWLFHVSGMIGTVLGYVDWFLPKTPLNLLVCFSLLIWVFQINGTKQLATVAFLFAAGMLVEWIGVTYGFLFGAYHYGSNLGTKLDGVPFMIGINWAMLVMITGAISDRLFNNQWLKVLLGASLMVGLDFFIEPSAPLMDFWYWELGHPPLRNYIAWFAIALILHWVYQRNIKSGHFAFSLHLYVAQLIFFIFFYAYYNV